MFSARTSVAMASDYLPNRRLFYERIMNETRSILTNLERRFQRFSQQQLIFVTALDRCRKTAFEPSKQISTLAQVQNYAQQVSDNATDKRIFNIFLTMVQDLADFRRFLCKLSKRKCDGKLNKTFSTWKKILESRQDISKLRARFPYCHVNHLSCDEARNHFGGIVSVLPVAMECARDAVERIEKIRAYREITRNSEESAADSLENSPNEVSGNVPQNNSPVISSPISSNSSRVSFHTQKSFSKPADFVESKERPASAYAKQVLATDKAWKKQSPRRPKSGIATQPPKYLVATLKPALNWPHKTISEAEMRKMLEQKKHSLGRPEWKP